MEPESGRTGRQTTSKGRRCEITLSLSLLIKFEMLPASPTHHHMAADKLARESDAASGHGIGQGPNLGRWRLIRPIFPMPR
jgi:hypothetical protein